MHLKYVTKDFPSWQGKVGNADFLRQHGRGLKLATSDI